MRLSCPNCGAQYEVPAEVIPQNGRDVQCSNCGHTWFQLHPDHDTEMSVDLGTSAPDEGWSPTEDKTEDTPTPNEAAAPEVDNNEVQPPDIALDVPPESAPADTDPLEEAIHDMVNAPEEADPEDDVEDEHPVSPASRPRRQIDPEVIDVLREEAAHEAQLRAQDAESDLSIQPDLGLDAPLSAPADDSRTKEAHARMRRMRGLPEDADPSEDTEAQGTSHHASRRDLLPDIEEINSTLRSTDEPSREDHPVIAMNTRNRRRSGFRLGFGFTMLAAAFVLLAYVYNQDIVAAWPAGEPYMTAFVDKMNTARLWMDTQMTTAMLWLDEKAATAGGNLGKDISQ